MFMARKFVRYRGRGASQSSIGRIARLRFWSMLLKAATEPELLVVGEQTSTVSTVRPTSKIYFYPDEHTCALRCDRECIF